MANYHKRFLDLAEEIEATFPVADWQVGDVPVWPLARAVLYSNVFQDVLGEGGAEGHASRQRLSRPARLGRAVAHAATPLVNLWRSRSDLRNTLLFPHRATALFLGDGDSLDLTDRGWRDRFCEPLIDRLAARGDRALLMQRGNFRRLPRARPTLAANTIVNWGQLLGGRLRLSSPPEGSFPDHEAVMSFLVRNGAPVLNLSIPALGGRARTVASTASLYEQVLKIARPSLCFIVGYFWGMGHALALACRRRGVLSIELQREGRSARHEAYLWSAVPEHGYAILPAVFWTWTEADAAAITAWTKALKRPWHRSFHGGHPQLAAWADDDPRTRSTNTRINEIRARMPAEREILVALQAVDGFENEWNALASFIEAGPPQWRWWLRRHPSTVHLGDHGLGRLPAVRRPNVLVDLPTSLPLPALLPHMDALISATSGAAVEASMYGVRTFFLSPIAMDLHPQLFERQQAEVVTDFDTLELRLRNIVPGPKRGVTQPDLSEMLSRLATMAEEYRELCRSG